MNAQSALKEVRELAEAARRQSDENGVEFFDLLSDALREKIANERRVFDRCEIFYDCAVEVFTDTRTGATSVGWYKDNGRGLLPQLPGKEDK